MFSLPPMGEFLLHQLLPFALVSQTFKFWPFSGFILPSRNESLEVIMNIYS